MYFAKSVTLYNGATAAVHRVLSTVVTDAKITVNVASYADANATMTLGQTMYEMPWAAMTGDFKTALQTWIVSQSGPLTNAIVNDDPSELEVLRTSISAQVDATRDRVMYGGVPLPYGVVQSDEVSIRNILGSFQSAMLAKSTGAAFSLQWKLADNNYTTLDATGMITLGLAVMAHIQTCYATSWTLKSTIAAAADVATLQAIDVAGASWPLNSEPVPVNTDLPEITGDLTVGSTLTATSGTWTNSPSGYIWAWAANGTDISGATASTYVLTEDEVGKTMSVRVTAVRTDTDPAPVSSAVTDVVEEAPSA